MGDDGIGNMIDSWTADEPCELQSVSEKTRRKVRHKKMEFVGWGSRPLIDFLESINKDISTKFSLSDVRNIVNNYVKENNLTQPHKKKRILCDERLFPLFGKKTFLRVKIDDFLEKHFAENQSDSDDDFLFSSDDNEEKARKRHKPTLNSNGKDTYSKKRIQETPKSCFAAIIPANVKLLYLKKRLVQDLHKDEETFESKLVGSFVRVKSNPNDYLQKYPHQLVQVTGVKRPFVAATTCSDILLEVSNRVEDIRICQLSDDNFSEEECEDLCERVKSGSLKRPSTVEFQAKAEVLHEDITKHWLDRELHLLQNLIDRANEKGWRKELFEYLERKQLLQTPAEQTRLLLEVPKVIADELEQEAKPKEESNESPTSILRELSLVSTDSSEATQTLATQDIDMNKAPVSEDHTWVEVVGEAQKEIKISETVDVEKNEEAEAEASSVVPQQQKRVVVKCLQSQVIEVISDDDDDEIVENSTTGWHYVDPHGKVQGPFELETLKFWNDAKYFPPDFKVFQKKDHAADPVLLSQLLLPK